MLIDLLFQKARKFGYITATRAAVRALKDRAWALIRRRFLQSFSQFGEDLVIDRLLGHPKFGTYIDVGANHPDSLSNTKRFYDRGWRGINVEPNVKNHALFAASRPRDINLNVGVGSASGELTFYLFDPHEVSTFSPEAARQYRAIGYKQIGEVAVNVVPLAQICEQSGNPDFLSVDTEGFDLSVLQSNDWQRFRPRLVCVETGDHETRAENLEIQAFLSSVGYERVYFNGVNGIWRDTRRGPL